MGIEQYKKFYIEDVLQWSHGTTIPTIFTIFLHSEIIQSPSAAVLAELFTHLNNILPTHDNSIGFASIEGDNTYVVVVIHAQGYCTTYTIPKKEKTNDQSGDNERETPS